MKKFVFSLQAVFDLKKKEESNQKSELKRIEAVLNTLFAELKVLQEEYDSYAKEYRDYLSGSIEMHEMKQYNEYFYKQKEFIDNKKNEVKKMNEIKEKCVQKLVEISKEIKSFEKLREKKYEEYLIESKKEEAREMDDILSYKASGN